MATETERIEYLKTLARNLRWRRIDESKVQSIIRDASFRLNDADGRPEESLGTADDYAKTFDKGGSVAKGYAVTLIGLGLALIGIAVFLISRFAGWRETNPIHSVLVFLSSALLVFICVQIGSRIDSRLPRAE